MGRKQITYPRIAYALPSLVASVTKATDPRATPTAPAKTPCASRIAIACCSVVDVPKMKQVAALPNSDSTSTTRRPCFSATVAYEQSICGIMAEIGENYPYPQ